jgi:hypothetical protein
MLREPPDTAMCASQLIPKCFKNDLQRPALPHERGGRGRDAKTLYPEPSNLYPEPSTLNRDKYSLVGAQEEADTLRMTTHAQQQEMQHLQTLLEVPKNQVTNPNPKH